MQRNCKKRRAAKSVHNAYGDGCPKHKSMRLSSIFSPPRRRRSASSFFIVLQRRPAQSPGSIARCRQSSDKPIDLDRGLPDLISQISQIECAGHDLCHQHVGFIDTCVASALGGARAVPWAGSSLRPLRQMTALAPLRTAFQCFQRALQSCRVSAVITCA